MLLRCCLCFTALGSLGLASFGSLMMLGVVRCSHTHSSFAVLVGLMVDVSVG